MHGLHRNCVRPHIQERYASSPIPPELARPNRDFMVFITPKGKGRKWHAKYGCSGAVMPVKRGGVEVRRREPCSKCLVLCQLRVVQDGFGPGGI